MNSNIIDTRNYLSETGSSEVEVINELPGAEEIWKEIQELKKEMNEAKKIAAQKAAEPYLEKLAELEEQYSVVLKLSI